MLVHQHGKSRKRSSVMISAKFGIKVADMVRELKLDNEKEKMMTEYSVENIQKYFLLNHEIPDILKCSAEVLEFSIDDERKVMSSKTGL